MGGTKKSETRSAFLSMKSLVSSWDSAPPILHHVEQILQDERDMATL